MSVNNEVECDECRKDIENKEKCYCETCFESVKDELSDSNRKIEDRDDEISGLNETISELTEEIAKLKVQLLDKKIT